MTYYSVNFKISQQLIHTFTTVSLVDRLDYCMRHKRYNAKTKIKKNETNSSKTLIMSRRICERTNLKKMISTLTEYTQKLSFQSDKYRWSSLISEYWYLKHVMAEKFRSLQRNSVRFMQKLSIIQTLIRFDFNIVLVLYLN